MTDRKKNSHRSQTTALKTPSRKQTQVEKSVEAPVLEDRELNKPVSVKSAKAPAPENHREPTPIKGTKTEARQLSRQETKAASRREPKAPPRWRNNAAGRFIYDAYYELRHKVTWPTLIEARNMTLVVLALS